jgi:hypothetical protein
VTEPAGRPTHVAQGPIFHTGRISDASSGVPTSGWLRFSYHSASKQRETERDQRSKECVIGLHQCIHTFERFLRAISDPAAACP